MPRASQQWMLVEMIVIALPVTIIAILFAPLVLMLAFSQPFQVVHLMLGVTYCFSCAALFALWVLGMGFWNLGTRGLMGVSKGYTVLATLGCFIAVISCIMAIAGYATAFLLGVCLIVPYAHLMCEMHTRRA